MPRDPFDEFIRPVRTPPPAPPREPPGSSGLQRGYEDLVEIAVQLTSSLHEIEILNRVVDGVLRLTKCRRGCILLRGDDGSFTKYLGRDTDGRDWEESSGRKISETMVSRVAESATPFIWTNTANVAEARGIRSIQEGQLLSVICLPLTGPLGLTGVIYADSTHLIPEFWDSHQDLLYAFRSMASVAIQNGRLHNQLQSENLFLSRELARPFSIPGYVSKNKEMQKVFGTIKRIAPHDIPVMILGERGVGKDMIARAIHEFSERRKKSYEVIDCGVVPETLAEDYFFGHVKGAFSGAVDDRAGPFERANGGTVFMDEIGNMPLSIQAKILRVLEEPHEILRVGGTRPVRVDVRVVVATNANITKMVGGSFREDLFDRLDAQVIRVPPLRERPEDIVPLAEYFLSRYAHDRNEATPRLSVEARKVLVAYDWPGNVRELRNLITVAYTIQDEKGVIGAEAVERAPRSADSAADVDGSLAERVRVFEAWEIRRALATHGSVTAAAEALGISRPTIYEKMKRYGIRGPSGDRGGDEVTPPASAGKRPPRGPRKPGSKASDKPRTTNADQDP